MRGEIVLLHQPPTKYLGVLLNLPKSPKYLVTQTATHKVFGRLVTVDLQNLKKKLILQSCGLVYKVISQRIQQILWEKRPETPRKDIISGTTWRIIPGLVSG